MLWWKSDGLLQKGCDACTFGQVDVKSMLISGILQVLQADLLNLFCVLKVCSSFIPSLRLISLTFGVHLSIFGQTGRHDQWALKS